MCDVFHCIIIVQDIDAGVYQSQVGADLHVAGIQHVGQQCHPVLIAVIGNAVILIRQPDAVLLGTQIGKSGQEIYISLLYGIFHLLLHQLVAFLCLAHVQPRLFQFPVILELVLSSRNFSFSYTKPKFSHDKTNETTCYMHPARKPPLPAPLMTEELQTG